MSEQFKFKRYRVPSVPMLYVVVFAASLIGVLLATYLERDVLILSPAGMVAVTVLTVFLIMSLLLYAGYVRRVRLAFQHYDEAALMADVFDASNEAIIITDAYGVIERVNRAFCHITGYSPEEVIGQNPSMMRSDRHGQEFFDAMWEELRTEGHWQGEVWDRRKDGELYAKWLSISSLRLTDGGPRRYVGIFTDITAMKQTEEYYEFLAYHDQLTRLPNRILFIDRLMEAIHDSANGNTAVMLLDVDRFKSINDMMGHAVGDKVLMILGERLSKAIRPSDTVARLGGDEFAILLKDVPRESAAAMMARKIAQVLEEPFRFGHYETSLTVSIGITLSPQDGDKPNQLMRNADIAMYEAKATGRNTFRFFQSEMHGRVVERQRVEKNLRLGLENNEMVSMYQPLVDLKTGTIIGFESLIRRQEENWLVPPGIFIAVAEETGLIVDIAEYSLRESCRIAKKWVDEGLPPMRVAVNISAQHFNRPDFVKTVLGIIEETGIEPAQVEIELTERSIMSSADEIMKKMKKLKSYGIHFSIDDFGTGYSSLSYLNKFEVEKLKIDYSFVRDITSSTSGPAIIRAIISLAHSLNMNVLAEGVETPEQLEFLRREGCDAIQGFFFSFPVPEENFREMLVSGRNLNDKEYATSRTDQQLQSGEESPEKK